MDIESEGEPGEDGVIDDSFRIGLMEEHLVQLHRRDSRRRELFWRASVDVYR